ncbi:RHS repeat-associated protein [Actinokineospora baliensis]|uniref:RHS repeat-associated core domain-containing protein n=1 Tax=Actinokineospora baliensis TaxID=547056 RepID=UPI00195D03DF|nr:RHS repeat-associated core domain-containing protein [Actinokineospora baliensis]MBM7774692.1 RHS repeat-associated protein [Actinokineospora baliensis]
MQDKLHVRHVHSPPTRLLLIAVLVAMVTTALAAIAPPPSAATTESRLPAPPREKVVAHQVVPVGAVRAVQAVDSSTRSATVWPAAGGAEVSLGAERAAPAGENRNSAERAAPAGNARRAGVLPVRVAAAPSVRTPNPAVRVEVAARSVAERTGTAVVLSVLPSAGDIDAATVSLDYASFRHAGGADLGSRLRLVRLPACALSTPQVAACQTRTPVSSSNDVANQTVTATLPIAAEGRDRSATVLAAVADADGSNGAFSASSLSLANTWGVTGSTGGFTWSYPITVPPIAAGTSVLPSINLGYSSASVDGRTAATNNQGSWIGQGWSYSPGYVERTYRQCAEDTTLPQASQTGDLCWAGQIVSMNLSGRATSLVRNDADGSWRPASDDGTRVELLTGAANGARNGEHWRVTTTDGVQYYFGRDSGPGRTTQDTTGSTWTVPVHGPRSGDPCYNAAGFAQSKCDQAWRWNLDYVEDPHGNAALYYYTPESNYYGANKGTAGVKYTRGGVLKRIDYGMRKVSGSVYGAVPAQVVFDVAERCLPAGGFTCDPAQFTAANASKWPDTPQDQHCLVGATCNNHAPSFWSTKRLTTITTKYDVGAGPKAVDSYALTQVFPSTGDPELRLDGLVRTAYDGAGAGTAMAPVTFTSQLLDNRVSGYNNQPAMAHWRLTGINTETGAHYLVSYLPVECTASTVPAAPATNTKRCYPVYWHLPLNPNPVLDYFHIYPVSQVLVQDGNGLSPTRRSDYTYLGTPAWHFDDNELVKPAHRTYGQFRGYAQVEVRTGDPGFTGSGAPDAQRLTRTTYFRGMHGDTLPANQQRTASVTNSLGETFVDDALFVGVAHEEQTFLGSGGAQLSTVVTEPVKVATTATRARTGLAAATADIVQTARTREITNLAAGGVRATSEIHRYDALGRLVATTSAADATTDQCATFAYADDTAAWIRNRVAQSWKSTAACPTTGPVTAPAPVVEATRQYFDGQGTLGVVAGRGNLTKTETAVANATDFQTTDTATYDLTGRVVSRKDALLRETTTAYTPVEGGILSQYTTTNAKNQTATVTLDPARGSTTAMVDVAGRRTDATHDSFGRVTAVWKPGRSKAGGESANSEFSYLLRADGPLAVTSRGLVDHGAGTNYITKISLFDAFGQQLQSQADDLSDPTGVSNRVVSHLSYDSHGQVIRSQNRYITTGAPATALVSVPDASVDDRTVTSYDAAGRVTQTADYQGTTLKATTTTVHGGDRVTVFPPTGGVTKTSITDSRGREVETRSYQTQPAVTGNVVSGGTAVSTTFRFTAAGRLDRSTDTAGNKWEFEYDYLGRQTGVVDPDAGHSTRTYDLADQVTTATDGRGQVLSYDYDALGRRLAEYSGAAPATRTKLASWVFDTASGGTGQLASTTRFTADGNYQVGVTGYNALGLPQNNIVSVPSQETGLNGLYTTTYSYTGTGQLTGISLPTKGGLPGEALAIKLNRYGSPTETYSNVWDYVSGTSYSPVGEESQYLLSSGSNAGTLTFERDPRTHAVNHTNLSVQRASPLVDDLTYTRDPAGNLTKIVNARSGSTRTQCFGYDALNRLSTAWTATDGCAGQPSTTPGATNVGGPDPYWTSWTFTANGLRTGQTRHGIGQADTTTTYTYPAAAGARPHALTSTSTTGPGGNTGSSFAYDNAGNTTSRDINGTVHTLTWTENNRLKRVQSPAGDTTYTYDADGNQLVRREPGKVILYLPGQEFARDTATGTITGTRYYTHNGTKVARRVGSGAPEYLHGDQHGTAQVSVSAVGFAETRREMDPYGNPVGVVQGGPWADNRGFLDKPTNATTGLVDVGVRQYDPVLGRFASVDPVLDPADPQSWTGYGYASNNPTTHSDPTGLFCDGCATGSPANTSVGCSTGRAVCSSEAERREEKEVEEFLSGRNTDRSKQPKIADVVVPTFKELKERYPLRDYLENEYGIAIHHWADRICGGGSMTSGPEAFCLEAHAQGLLDADNTVLLQLLPGYDAFMCVSGQDSAACLTAPLDFIPFGKLNKLTKSLVRTGERALLSELAESYGKNIIPAACNSFVGGTRVLMADGGTKAIEYVEVGDVVASAAPGGELESHAVTALHITDKDTRYVTLGVGTGEVVVTDHHLVFDTAKRIWVRADELVAGDPVQSPGGGAEVTSTRVHSMAARTYDLTVDTRHTYHVLAGDTPVLVHNCLTILRDWTSKRYMFGNQSFLLDKRGMDHILTRHHPTYWNGSVKATQSFFDRRMSVNDVQDTVSDVLKQNRDTLATRGSRGMYQVRGTVNGKEYVVGLNNGRVGQLYPVASPP